MRRPGGTLPRPLHVPPASQKDRNVPKEELLQFEGLVLEILPDARYRVQLDNGVDALGLLVDLVGEPAPSPDVHLVDSAAGGRDDLQELLKRRLDGPLLKRGIEDDHHLIAAHTLNCLLWTHAATVSPWQEEPRAASIGGPARPCQRTSQQ